jgi:hypothetical protein
MIDDHEHPTPGEKRGVVALKNALVARDLAIEPFVTDVAERLLSGHHHVNAWPEDENDD